MIARTEAEGRIRRGEVHGRRGAVLVLVSLFLVTLIAIAGLAIDVGMAYRQQGNMQSACDAAALAAVVDMPYSMDTACQTARALAQVNGFPHGVNNCSVDVVPQPAGNPFQYQVAITQPYDTLFVRIVGANRIDMSCQAIAQYMSLLPVNIYGGSTPGQESNVATLSCFGPHAYHSYGDAYSTRWLNNGGLNPTYRPGGYDFSIDVPAPDAYFAKYGTYDMKVEIYDPDCGNPSDASDGVDEIRGVPGNPHPQLPAGVSQNTVTRYQLFSPTDHPNDTSRDTPVASVQYGKDATVSQRWVNPTGFTVDVRDYLAGKYRLNVTALSGSSENGYNLRVGPPGMDWNPATNPNIRTQALSIKATGYLPLNLYASGTLNIDFGDIPASPVAYKVHVTKFDTDVGAQSVQYKDTNGNTWNGVLAGDDKYKEDVFTIPAGYTGGSLTAVYRAGSADSSSWSMYFEGTAPGQPGKVKLVQ